MRTQLHSSGFTLIELLVVVVIVAVLAALAIPSYNTYIAHQRSKTAAQNLFFSMTLARSEAIKRNTTVEVDADASGWAGGWTVKNASATFRTQNALDGVTISEANATASVAYGSDGRLTTTTLTPPHFTICDTKNVSSQQIVAIDLSGAPQLSQGNACP